MFSMLNTFAMWLIEKVGGLFGMSDQDIADMKSSVSAWFTSDGEGFFASIMSEMTSNLPDAIRQHLPEWLGGRERAPTQTADAGNAETQTADDENPQQTAAPETQGETQGADGVPVDEHDRLAQGARPAGELTESFATNGTPARMGGPGPLGSPVPSTGMNGPTG